MLPLSQSTGYAVRALAYLQGAGGHPVLVEEIAESTGIPRFYLSKLVHRLAKRGLLIARQGHHGGVALARPLTEIRLVDLSDAVDGASWRNRGLMGLLGYTQNAHCVYPEALPETLIQLAANWRSLTIADLVPGSGFERFLEGHWKHERTRAAGPRDQRKPGLRLIGAHRAQEPGPSIDREERAWREVGSAAQGPPI